MHDAEHKHHSILLDHVVHHSMIANAQPVERVARSLDGLHRLTADASRRGHIESQLLQCSGDPLLGGGGQLLEDPDGRWCELDIERAQRTSFRLVVRPFA